MELGTFATVGELLERDTETPPATAGPLSVTVPVEVLLPATDAGLRLNPIKAMGLTVSVAVWVTEPSVAEIVAVDDVETDVVATVNVAVVDPAGTVTETGTLV